jgi:hypothetical protein
MSLPRPWFPLLGLLFTAAFAGSVHAAGLNLSWGDCGSAGVLQRNFACDTNVGTNTMYGSAVVQAPMPQLNGQESTLGLQTSQASLSNWWQFATGGCRNGSPGILSADFNFTSSTSCLDPWAGTAAGGVVYEPAFFGPNASRIRVVSALPGSTSINATSEYYIFKLTFLNARTVGTGSCAGCFEGACFVYQQLRMTQPIGSGLGDQIITTPLTRAFVVWQGGASGALLGSNGSGCLGATPSHHSTWGSVKSLYR